jgi:hypothetical protein
MEASDEELFAACEMRLTDYLRRGDRKFSMETIVWKLGFLPKCSFKKFLKIRVKEGRLIATKDELGIVWYSLREGK